MLDNHIYQGNTLNIDNTKVVIHRAVDMNDRQLRFVQDGLGGKFNGVPRNDGYDITVATEVMAVMCLSSSIADLKERLGKIIVAYTYDDKPVTAKDLKADGAMTALLVEALKPNLVQTLEGTPAFVHCGPFANIAHGCNSILATKMALKLGDYCVTEAGFGADLGAEKFLDIKCRMAGLKPDAVVLVATIRALKLHGGVEFENLSEENVEALSIGVENLRQHAENLKKYGVPIVIAMNHFKSDSEAEVAWLRNWCVENNYTVGFFDSFINGGDGATELATKVVEVLETKRSNFKPIYDTKLSIKEKIVKICSEIYRCNKVTFLPLAEEKIEKYEGIAANLPVCIAKTPLSFSDNPNLKNAPRDFEITVKDIAYKSGSKFLVVYLGNILTMPGLPKIPNAVHMEDENA
jgi:formate--tetrahydrofolate ligase